jgi:hypothetical protein
MRVYEIDLQGDMSKNELLWNHKVDGGVSQADFMFSTLYDMTSSQISDV